MILTKKETVFILLGIITIAFSISLLDLQKSFFISLLFVFIVVSVNIIAKKLTAFHYDSEIEIGLWEIKQTGYRASQHLKKPFPLGLFLPMISKAIFFPFQNLAWMAALTFDVKPKVYKAAKRHGLYKFSEMTEYHLGIIAAAGIFANLVIGAAAYLLNYPALGMISIYYAFFNMIPISSLDGNKVFFGNITMWTFLASLVLLGLIFVIFIV